MLRTVSGKSWLLFGVGLLGMATGAEAGARNSAARGPRSTTTAARSGGSAAVSRPPSFFYDPVYYGTTAYFQGVSPNQAFRPRPVWVDPGVYQTGFYAPQPGFVTDLFP